MSTRKPTKPILTLLALLGVVSLSVPSTTAIADTGSASWLKWRSSKPVGPCQAKAKTITLGTHATSNYLVRGVGIFHRPIEDLLAQKAAVIPEVRWQYTKDTEFAWDSAFALQAPELTRLEIQHAEGVQNFRVHHCIELAKDLALLTAGNIAFTIEESLSIRSEAAVSLLKRITNLNLELGLLHHQAILGDSPLDWAFTHAHIEAFEAYVSEKWRVIPYARLSAERQSFDWSSASAFAYQLGIRWNYELESIPLGLSWSTDFLQRIDLKEYTINLAFGLSWNFEHE